MLSSRKLTSDSVESSKPFDANCSDCPRLVAHLNAMGVAYPLYFNAPVPTWGGKKERLLIVGLAPGLHGANRTGRPFTGDSSGEVLFEALANNGLAEIVKSPARVKLTGCRITNAVRCLPPRNNPTTFELDRCRPYLHGDIQTLLIPRPRVNRCIVVLGRIAYRSVSKVLNLRRKFEHGAQIALSSRLSVFVSYHPSRLNINTRRLTKDMLNHFFRTVRSYLDG